MPSPLTIPTFALVTLLSTAAAWAQPAQLAPESSGVAPTDVAKTEAKRRFEHAIKLYEDADYTLALAEFERVYELVPDYRVLYNIGQVSMQLGRYARAYRTLKEYSARGSSELSPERRRAVDADLELLSGRVATITVSVAQAGAEVSLDGAVVGTAPLATALIVDVGERTLQIRLPGYSTQTQSLTLAGGDRRESSFSLEREAATTPAPPTEQVPVVAPSARPIAPAPARPSRTWIGWTTTGTLTAGAIVAGALGASAASDLKSLRATAGAERSALEHAHDRAQTRLLVADVLAAAAVVSGGVTLYFQLSGSHAKPDAARAPLKLQLTASNVSLVFEN